MKTLAFALVLTLAGGSTTLAAPTGSRAQLSLPEARTAALKLQPGSVRKSELERERGGGGLRCVSDIDVEGVVYEVGIDAVPGRVLENGKG